MQGGQTDHSGHRARLKRSLRENGLAAFASHEVIEILLYSALPRRDVNGLAHRLDDAFGGIGGLLRADREALMDKGGLSENMAEFICAAGECVRACALDETETALIRTRQDAEAFLMRVPGKCSAVFLSSGRQVIFSSPVPESDGAKFIFTHALTYDAASVIVKGGSFPGLGESLRLTGTEYVEING